LKIAICIKQVPGSNELTMDQEKGILQREDGRVKMNPYDLVAIETALQIKEKYKEVVITSFSMGPKRAREVILSSYAMGVDQGVLITDPKFIGSDVYATALTLSKGISLNEEFDIVICGRQTTDGDTGQVGPAIAEHLGIPHIYGVIAIDKIEEKHIFLSQQIENKKISLRVKMPCVLVISKEAYIPRLPSLKLKLEAKKKKIKIMSFEDLNDSDIRKFGLEGSPTQVEKIYFPNKSKKETLLSGNANVIVDAIIERLKGEKLI